MLLVVLLALVGVVAARLRREPAARRDGAVRCSAAATTRPTSTGPAPRPPCAAGGFDDALVEAFRALASRRCAAGWSRTGPG